MRGNFRPEPVVIFTEIRNWDSAWSSALDKADFQPFQANEVLSPDRLNEAFASVLRYNELEASKPIRKGRVVGIEGGKAIEVPVLLGAAASAKPSKRPEFMPFSRFPGSPVGQMLPF